MTASTSSTLTSSRGYSGRASSRKRGIEAVSDSNIFVENLVEKEEFLHTFSKECEYIRTAVTNGSAIKHDGSYESDPAVEIVRVELQGAAAFLLFSSGTSCTSSG
uniref:Uncharacterized protein n=1 Tax=Zea mays TaxID=4577 RepID=A0A804M2I9_MAIZE